jgi:hypothetical protein
MRIEKWIDFSQNVEISISAEDIANCFDTSPRSESVMAALSLINDTATVYNGLSDSIIDSMSAVHHKTIREFLLKAAGRFQKTDQIASEQKEI